MNQSNPSNTDILDVLTREGVLINVSVRYPRFHKKLNPADLGLNPEQVSDRLMSLGHKRLLPKEALAALALCESRAHSTIDQSTFPFLGGIGHFLPNAKLEEVRQRLDVSGATIPRSTRCVPSGIRQPPDRGSGGMASTCPATRPRP